MQNMNQELRNINYRTSEHSATVSIKILMIIEIVISSFAFDDN